MSGTYRGYLATVLSSIGFASFSLFLKLVLHAGVGVWTYTLLSSVGSLLILALFMGRHEEPLLPRLRVNWADYLLFAGCGALSTLSMVLALVHLSISLATMLLFTYPAVVTIANWAFFGVRPTRHHLTAVALTLLGAALTVNLTDLGAGQASPIGILYALLTSVGHGMYIALGPKLADDLPPIGATALTRAVVCLAVLLFFPVASVSQIPHITWNGWYLIGLSTLITGVPPYFLLNLGVGMIGSNKAAVVSVVELPIAMGIGILFQGERVTGMQWLGALLILSALLVSHRHPASAKVL